MRIVYFILFFLMANSASAKLAIVTTIPDLKALASEIGGDLVSVDAIAKGTQDPHYIEAKPSFMAKISRADLVISVGLDLEVGWLPSILNGARNPKVNPGNPGNLELGPMIEPLDIPEGKVTRAEGDVHPLGNPHFYLDPVRMGIAALKIAERMAELDPSNAVGYRNRAKALQSRMLEKTKLWQARIDRSGVKKIVTYHKTLTYFFRRFGLENPAILEPKPGIPPTSGHVLKVIQLIKSQNIPLILVENFFDPTVTNRIKEDIPTVRAVTVPVAVDGAPGVDSLDELYEKLTSTIESKI